MAYVKQKLFVALTILGLLSIVRTYYMFMKICPISASSAMVRGEIMFGTFVQFLYNILDISNSYTIY